MSESIMAFAALTGATAEGVAGLQGAEFQRAQGKWAREGYDFEARMAELQAVDAERRGLLASRQARAQGRQVIGSQRAALAAQGVDVASGSALDVQADTAYQAELDAATIQNNAWREAYGLRTQASKGRFAGRMAEIEGESKAGATMLTGGLRFASGAMSAASALKSGMSPKGKPQGKPQPEYSVSGRKVYMPMDLPLKPKRYR
jgi:hypothetical protein